MLYYCLYPEFSSEEDRKAFFTSSYTAASTCLPPFRLEKSQRYKHPSDACSSALAYLLLCYALRREYPAAFAPGCQPDFIYSSTGKPYLKDHPDIFFSLSHCKTGVALALSDSEIGLDMQDNRKLSPALLAKPAFSGLAPAQQTARWSLLEATSKLIGTGISDPDFFLMHTEGYQSAHGIYTSTIELPACSVPSAQTSSTLVACSADEPTPASPTSADEPTATGPAAASSAPATFLSLASYKPLKTNNPEGLKPSELLASLLT